MISSIGVDSGRPPISRLSSGRICTYPSEGAAYGGSPKKMPFKINCQRQITDGTEKWKICFSRAWQIFFSFRLSSFRLFYFSASHFFSWCLIIIEKKEALPGCDVFLDLALREAFQQGEIDFERWLGASKAWIGRTLAKNSSTQLFHCYMKTISHFSFCCKLWNELYNFLILG